MAKVYSNETDNIFIQANTIHIGEAVTFGKSIDIKIKGDFFIGDHSRLGNDVNIRGNNVKIGDHLFHSQGLRIGGGGRQHPKANFSIGDRCTIQTISSMSVRK